MQNHKSVQVPVVWTDALDLWPLLNRTSILTHSGIQAVSFNLLFRFYESLNASPINNTQKGSVDIFIVLVFYQTVAYTNNPTRVMNDSTVNPKINPKILMFPYSPAKKRREVLVPPLLCAAFYTVPLGKQLYMRQLSSCRHGCSFSKKILLSEAVFEFVSEKLK